MNNLLINVATCSAEIRSFLWVATELPTLLCNILLHPFCITACCLARSSLTWLKRNYPGRLMNIKCSALPIIFYCFRRIFLEKSDASEADSNRGSIIFRRVLFVQTNLVFVKVELYKLLRGFFVLQFNISAQKGIIYLWKITIIMF